MKLIHIFAVQKGSVINNLHMLYFILFFAIIILAIILITIVGYINEKIFHNDNDNSIIFGCLFWLIVISAIIAEIYLWGIFDGEYDLHSPFRL